MKLLDEIRSIESTPKKLKEFGLTIGVVFLIILGYFFFKYGQINYLLAGSAILFIAAAFIFPAILKAPQKIWMALAVLLGAVMSRVILGVLFFCVVTPIALFLKALKKDLLDQAVDKAAATYWKEHRCQEKDFKPDYEKMF